VKLHREGVFVSAWYCTAPALQRLERENCLCTIKLSSVKEELPEVCARACLVSSRKLGGEFGESQCLT